MNGSERIAKISQSKEGNKKQKQVNGIEMIIRISQTETQKTRRE
jgi:hypothetical protein